MKPSDLRALRMPLAVLLMVMLASGALIFYTKRLADASFHQLQQQQNQLREARIRYQKSGDEKEIINRYLDDYLRLQKQGFIGTEPRMNWLDGLRIANQQAELFGVEYQIGAQQPYALASSTSSLQKTSGSSILTSVNWTGSATIPPSSVFSPTCRPNAVSPGSP